MEISPSSLCEETREAISSFKIRVANTLGELGEVWPRTDCCGTAHCYVFQCADFLEIWCDTIGKARRIRPFFIGVFDNAGQAILLLPLGIERMHGLRVLRFLDGGVCDYNAPVVLEPTRRWQRDTIQQVWQELIRALPRFDIAIFDKMPADVCGVPNPFVFLGSKPFSESGHLTNITGSWDEYVATKLPYRRKSGQQRRKLAKVGPVLFRVAETSAERQHIVQAMMRQKSRRCIETGQSDELGLPGYRQYYITMTERFIWPGPLLVAALKVGDDIVSTSWSLILDRRFLWLVTTFEGDEWRRFSPGRILLEHLLEWCFANRITIFDSGIGDEGYKLEYSDQEIALYQSHIPVTLLGKFYHTGRETKIWRALRPLAKRAMVFIRRGRHAIFNPSA
jgi:CelD/BcsL family acetyltransferase involved in cellulose biosynthesis